MILEAHRHRGLQACHAIRQCLESVGVGVEASTLFVDPTDQLLDRSAIRQDSVGDQAYLMAQRLDAHPHEGTVVVELFGSEGTLLVYFSGGKGLLVVELFGDEGFLVTELLGDEGFLVAELFGDEGPLVAELLGGEGALVAELFGDEGVDLLLESTEMVDEEVGELLVLAGAHERAVRGLESVTDPKLRPPEGASMLDWECRRDDVKRG